MTTPSRTAILLLAVTLPADPARIKAGETVKIQLIATIDTPDILALDAEIRTSGATTFVSFKPAKPPGGASGLIIDPQRTRPRIGDTVNPIPPGSYAFGVLEVKAGTEGDQILVVDSTVVNARFCSLNVKNQGEVIAEVAGDGATAPAGGLPETFDEATHPHVLPPVYEPNDPLTYKYKPADPPAEPAAAEPAPRLSPAPAPTPAASETGNIGAIVGIAVLVLALALVGFMVLRRRA